MIKDDYKPRFLLKNGHINTIYTALKRQAPQVGFERQRITTHDHDFLDIDRIKQRSSKVVVLCHGLEGSSSSKYILGSSKILSEAGFDICAMNYRYCSGEINLQAQMYHSGWTVDLHTVVNFIEPEYEEIYLLGFSLGGNLVLKYCGEDLFNKTSKLKAVSAISTPLNLLSSSIQMLRLENRLYTNRFLRTLNEKLKQKHKQFPDHFDLSHIPKVKSVMDFDDFYTGPLNGYRDARDYYQQCSSDQFLPTIQIPALVINAIDDPFLGDKCYPSAKEVSNSKVNLVYTNHGGHVGFYDEDFCWEEKQVLKFILSVSKA